MINGPISKLWELRLVRMATSSHSPMAPLRTPRRARIPSLTKSGINILGHLEGTADTDLTMIITAHYDHVGEIDGEIYNGADDNASGVVGLA